MRESLLCFAATISPFLSSSHLITTVLIPSCVTWAFLTSSEFIWTLLFSALLSFSILRSSSQLNSSQLFSCQVVSTHPISVSLRFSQYYFVLQSLHKALPSTTLYDKVCTKYFQLCTPLQDLHKILYTQPNFYTERAFTHRSFYTEKRLHTARFYKQELLHTLQPLRYDPRCPAAKDEPWCSHYSAICKDPIAKHHRTTRGSARNCSSKTESQSPNRKKGYNFEAHLKVRNFQGKTKGAKNDKKQQIIIPASSPFENKAFVRALPRKVKVEDAKTKLSCKGSLKKWKSKMWSRSFRARGPSKRESWSYENEAFGRDFSNFGGQAWSVSSHAGPTRAWFDHSRACSETVARQTLPIHLPRPLKLRGSVVSLALGKAILKLKHVDVGIIQHGGDNALQFLQVICFPTLLSSVGKLTFLEFLVDELLVTNALKKQGMSNGFSQDHSVEHHIASPTLFPMGTLQGTTGHVPSP